MNRKRKFVLVKLIIAFSITFSFLAHYFLYQKFCLETRYAFDFGSGAIKSKAVEFDVCANKIHKVFGQFDKPIKFINCLIKLENNDYRIDEKCLNRAAIEFGNFESEYNISCKVNKCAGVATAWARKADNAGIIIDALAKQGVQMKILSQFDEGVYAFNAVLKSGEIDSSIDPQEIIVWDIGGGSFQLTTLDPSGNIHVYNGAHGIESFEKEIRNILELSADNKLPFFAGNALDKALDYGYQKYGLLILKDRIIADKLKNPRVKIYAIGGPMTKGLKKQMYMPTRVTLKNLHDTAKVFENRTESDVYWNSFPELPMHYVKSAQVSLILIHGILKGTGFKEINILDSTISDYVLFEKKLWRKPKKVS